MNAGVDVVSDSDFPRWLLLLLDQLQWRRQEEEEENDDDKPELYLSLCLLLSEQAQTQRRGTRNRGQMTNRRRLKLSKKNTGCMNKNCNGIVIEVSPIPLEHQIIPLMYKDQPIDRQESLNIIEERSKLPRKNFLV